MRQVSNFPRGGAFSSNWNDARISLVNSQTPSSRLSISLGGTPILSSLLIVSGNLDIWEVNALFFFLLPFLKRGLSLASIQQDIPGTCIFTHDAIFPSRASNYPPSPSFLLYWIRLPGQSTGIKYSFIYITILQQGFSSCAHIFLIHTSSRFCHFLNRCKWGGLEHFLLLWRCPWNSAKPHPWSHL